MKKLLLLSGIALFVITANAQWVSNGPANQTIYALAISGSNIFASGDSGMYLSTDSGGSWMAINTGLPANTGVLSLAVSGSNIFAGSCTGVFLSNNDGANWTAADSGLTVNGSVSHLAVSGSNIFASTGNGIFLSTNNGDNWTKISPDSIEDISALAVSGSNIFIATVVNGIFLSTDTGRNWAAANTGLPLDPGLDAFAIDGSNILQVAFLLVFIFLQTMALTGLA